MEGSSRPCDKWDLGEMWECPFLIAPPPQAALSSSSEGEPASSPGPTLRCLLGLHGSLTLTRRNLSMIQAPTHASIGPISTC